MKTASGIASIVLGLLATSAFAAPTPLNDAQLSRVVAGENFTVVNEVSDQASVGAPTTDPLLVNSWGLAQAPFAGPLWVANNGTGTSTVYLFQNFAKLPLNVTIPGAGGTDGAPTGTVFTSITGNTFRVSQNGLTGHSLFCSTARTARSPAGRRPST
jgi:hypothetical protein